MRVKSQGSPVVDHRGLWLTMTLARPDPRRHDCHDPHNECPHRSQLTMLTMPATLTPHTDHLTPTPTIDRPTHTTDHHNSRQKSMQHAAAPFTRCKLYRLCILSHMYRLCTQLCNCCSQCMQFAVTNERTSTTEHRRRRPRVRSFVRSFVCCLCRLLGWLIGWLWSGGASVSG